MRWKVPYPATEPESRNRRPIHIGIITGDLRNGDVPTKGKRLRKLVTVLTTLHLLGGNAMQMEG